MKIVTHKYKDGSTTSYEWFEEFDGDWPYPEFCIEVVFNYNINNPQYEIKR